MDSDLIISARVIFLSADGLAESDIETVEMKSTIRKCFPRVVEEYEEGIQQEKEKKGTGLVSP